MAQLSKHGLETLWKDGDFILSRSTLADEPAPVLVLAPASERPAPGIIARLEHAYALRGELEPSSVARPLRLVHCGGLPALLLEDPGGNLLARLLGQPWELPQFLRAAIGVAVALGRLHARGLYGRDAERQVLFEAFDRVVAGGRAAGGNPFFAIQFLIALAEEGLLAFDPRAALWTWDLLRIRAKRYSDDVVELMAEKLKRLPKTTQQALKQLACRGNSANISTLNLVYGESDESIQAELWDAVRAGLVFSLDGTYTFLHDRIREAAYALIPESERAVTHLRIGRLFVSLTAPEEIQEKVFEIVNQLNRATSLITALEERKRVAELNLVAGKRAKISEAYASALNYLAASEAFLAEDCWHRDHALAFDVALNRAECQFRTGLLTEAHDRLSTLSEQAANRIEESAVACLRVALYMTQVQFDRAVEVCLEYLRRVGVEWSPHPTKDEVEQEFAKIWRQVGARAVEQLVDLPLTNDPDCRATFDVLSVLATPAWFTDGNLHDLVGAYMTNLSLEHGNSDGSCHAYALLGTILGATLGQYQAGFRFGELAVDLVEKHGLDRFKARVYNAFGHHKQLAIWKENCPENFASCEALVAAEIARIEGRELDAERLYEGAIQSAREHGFVQNEAIANEMAVRFYSGRGLETIARAHLQNARHLYVRWGALGKVKHLELRHPDLREQPRSPPGAIVGSSLEQVDVLALARASQAVSSELDPGKLTEKLLVIALENAGAQRGVLILLRGDAPQIEAEAINGHDAVAVNFHQAFPTPAELPDSILRYVIRTQESIILDDASAPNQFSVDEYVQKNQARSVLCLPLVKQASLKGALYLENNLASHVFTPDRVSVLRLLVSQAAISLDHARMYAELTQKNIERRRVEEELHQKEVSLREAQTELAHVSRVTTMGELAASIVHEVNQPLSGIITNANAGLRWLAGDSPNLAEAREAIRRIIRDGNRAGNVISRMRALFKKARTANPGATFQFTL